MKLSDLNEIRDRVNCMEKIAEGARREALQQESYNKRLNLLVRGVEKLPDTVRENKLQTQMKLYEVIALSNRNNSMKQALLHASNSMK